MKLARHNIALSDDRHYEDAMDLSDLIDSQDAASSNSSMVGGQAMFDMFNANSSN